jgi:glycosyltransferase involved in cell wall biosynthesis
MAKKPTVSVIIPTYNRAHLIGRAIKSVLNQTYQDFELIIIDDGSTDNTEDIIRQFQEKDKRIKYKKHDKNKGGSAARNTGIKNSKGKYIAFQDSDDEWLPNKLEKQMKIFKKESPNLGIVYTGFYRIKDSEKEYIPSHEIVKKEGRIYEDLLKESFITTQSILVRKECFKKVGIFDEKLPRLQDWELVIRLSKYYDFKCIDEPLLISYYNTDSISANHKALIEAHELILTKHYKNFNNYKKILSRHYFDLGRILYLDEDLISGRRYFIKAIKKYPLNIKYSLSYLVSFFGPKTFNKVTKIYHKFKYYFCNRQK